MTRWFVDWRHEDVSPSPHGEYVLFADIEPELSAKVKDAERQLAALRVLEAEWRKNDAEEGDYYYYGLWKTCADQLAAVMTAFADPKPE